jgi:hypothetical protein
LVASFTHRSSTKVKNETMHRALLTLVLIVTFQQVGWAHQPAFQMISLKQTGQYWQLVYSETKATKESVHFEPLDFMPYLSVTIDGKPLPLTADRPQLFQDGMEVNLCTLPSAEALTIRFLAKNERAKSTRILRVACIDGDTYSAFLKRNKQFIELVFRNGKWQINSTEQQPSQWLPLLLLALAVVGVVIYYEWFSKETPAIKEQRFFS